MYYYYQVFGHLFMFDNKILKSIKCDPVFKQYTICISSTFLTLLLDVLNVCWAFFQRLRHFQTFYKGVLNVL